MDGHSIDQDRRDDRPGLARAGRPRAGWSTPGWTSPGSTSRTAPRSSTPRPSSGSARRRSAAGREVAVLQDVPGPKLRLGPIAGRGGPAVGRGRTSRSSPARTSRPATAACRWRGRASRELVEPGQVVYLADGAIRLRVQEVVGRGGPDAGRGRRLAGLAAGDQPAERHRLAAGGLGRGPRADRRRASRWASTSSRSRSCAAARTSSRCARHLGDRQVPLIAKIEKPLAASNAEEIIEEADGVMVARGDLGIELPIEEVPLVQKRILHARRQEAEAVDHGHADARVDGAVDPADPRRGGGRGERDLRRHRRRDAVAGDRRRPATRSRPSR